MFTLGPLQRRAAWMRRLAVSLTFALGFLPFAGILPAAQAQGLTSPVTIKSILLFPSSASTDAGTGAADLTSALDDAIKLRLNLVGKYSVLSYTKFLPAVQRGLDESGDGGLTDADLQPPFTHDSAEKIASLVGTDAYMITTITSYKQDPATRHVTLGVATRVFYSQNGNPVPGLGGGFSGEAGPISASDTDANIQQGAINDAAARIASSLDAAAPQSAPIVTRASQRGNSSSETTRDIIGGVLLVALVTAIINGSHFGGSGGGSSSSSSSSSSGGSGSGSNSGSSPTGPPAPPSVP